MRIVLLLLLAAGCTAGMRPPDDPGEDFAGPIRSNDVGEGGRIYIELCSACHRGRVNPRGYQWSAAQMRHQIRRGNEIMPPLPVELISDDQVEAVLAYLVVSGALEGELPDAAIETTDAEDAVFDDDAFDDDDAEAFDDDAFDGDEESAQGLDAPQ